MAQGQDMTSAAPPRRRIGIIADGATKVVLAAVYLVGAAPLGDRLGVSVWLMVASGAALLIGGGIEVRRLRSRVRVSRRPTGRDGGAAGKG
ncbi:hypothetical protein GCM10022254_57400 [Actinomadura meridiana]|uniref:Uncharacterized protein n=1 Tax=Actinomadura meridiana TaxID=559626 RepID=A0ABP8CGK3_9ACTN